MNFSIQEQDAKTSARFGVLATDRGDISTPVFMPIGTYGAVKTLSPQELVTAGASIILGNTYHLYLRPGMDLIHQSGGLHSFMAWEKPILTDSGGFQVFSLAKLRKLSDEGVVFKSTLDGSEHLMTPEISMEIQRLLGSDIIMAFDECPPGDATRSEVEAAVVRTTKWAQQCADYLEENPPLYGKASTFFPIVQGGIHHDLRSRSAEQLVPLADVGIAMGGLAVGEEKSAMFDILGTIDELLPEDKARYLMGVGKPEDMVRAVAAGVDMFDCVIPTRNARNGQFFTWNGKLNILNGRYKDDFSPVDETCSCYACQEFTRAYLRHLFKLNEILALRMASLHNVTFYLSLMDRIRTEITAGTFASWSKEFLAGLEENSD
ncbi:MAG: tRNA guanosine(34) transglycosylase Tgt [Candidatus Marinimicrobia bacterium]|jgi:queuine tRNA-ribosyltransferase|nr:tRNA guanosine(34) transglycosylase Tgt [Candidatus Neomarinimicrobiota bacterium]MDP6568273.1 tRNA guanosine(34) transglycosylase Tgt [Candidatus Neomarinimicrobiota bacterium]MDP7026196.1 tRNA guanosine(34) transglycosylase Tgt [Candidatus Neomarinimicrobiota bacterium]|tara:strand:+ start:3836 stop:4966 length:1131 start_codon:yes stop_codon:yes gene_type:complete